MKRCVVPPGCGHFTSSQSIFVALAESQHHARVVRGQIAAAADFHAGALQVAGLPGDACADRVAIGLFSRRASRPASDSARAALFLQQKRRAVVDGDENVDRAVVVEIADGHAARRRLALRKSGPLCALTFAKPFPVL